MNYKRAFIIMLCLTVFAGCSTITHKRKQYTRNYSINVEKRTAVMSSMVIYEHIKYIKASRPTGDMQSTDHWQAIEYPSDDSFKEELIYRGRSGNIIRLSYREFRRDVTRPDFSQELTYDLSGSDIIIFKRYRIRVLDANNEYIRFIVLKD